MIRACFDNADDSLLFGKGIVHKVVNQCQPFGKMTNKASFSKLDTKILSACGPICQLLLLIFSN